VFVAVTICRIRLELAVRTIRSVFVVLSILLFPALASSQTTAPSEQSVTGEEPQTQPTERTEAPAATSDATESKVDRAVPARVRSPAPVGNPTNQESDDSEGKQTKRILWIVPNFSAVSANTRLPRLSAGGKLRLAAEDSVDYSSFAWAAVLAGQSMALNSYPELHQGAAGYGRYYWRAFADQASGAFFTEALVPALTHEDPRYYTLGHGGFLRRTVYALSQLYLTKTDSGGVGFNFSEILGNGMEAGLSNLYYPSQERGLRKTEENWTTGLESAALNNVVKEFWPDIRHKLLRQK
jgi:hypothetical protein